MFFGHNIIPDERQEQRWRVCKGPWDVPGGCAYLQLWEVEDLKLERQLFLLTLRYESIPTSRLSWDIPTLRRCFSQLVQALSANHLCFPEPIDFSTYIHPNLPETWATGEPFLIYAAPGGHALPPLSKMTPDDRSAFLRRICLNTAYALRDLHQHGCMIRALPLATLRRNAASGFIVFSAFPFLCEMHHFQGFSRHEIGFHPPSRHAAPECFAADGRLSPATDVYALGRMLLEALGEKLSDQPYSPQQLEDILASHQLDPMWSRFFKLALAIHPRERFDGMGEIISFMNTGRSETTPHNRWIQAGSSPRPRTQRPDAPPAALLLWADRLLPRNQRFRFRDFLAHCQSRYSLRPILLFTREQRDMNNAFFQLLRGLSFDIHSFPTHTPIRPWLSDLHTLWRDCPNLVIVGHTAEEGCQILIEQAKKSATTVELYATGGSIPAHLVSQDTSAFIDNSPRANASGQLPSRMHRTAQRSQRY